MDSKVSEVSGADSEILSRNGLFYKMPQSLSTSVNRTFKREFAQKQTYLQGQTMVFDLNTGSDYIDPTSCMLSFDLIVVATTNTPTVNDEYSFGQTSGTAANLISEIRILSKNGTEIDRTQNANVLAKVMTDYTYSVEGQKTLEMAGYLAAGGADFSANNAVPVTKKFVIPMSLISGFFRPTVKGMKLPSGLTSGLRIEMTLEVASRALFNTSNSTGRNMTYTLNNPIIFMMSHSLNDPTQAALMKNSAETGLEYTFPSYFNTPLTTASGSINEQVKKAVSQATSVFTPIYLTANATNELQDSFASIGSSLLENFQYRVGSNYYPQQSVSSIGQLAETTEAWYISLGAFNKMRDIRTFPANVDKIDYDTGGKFLVAVPLETDSLLNLSGVPLNNSNVLELRMSVTGAEKTFHIFVEYISIARTFINKTSIKI